ncbi:oxidoreductase [Rhizodiscina lignyota]|uniref:Oxidoreductase n=1 Tax=Rhizodiscina lignyota TaxID=1504668 RepID=A0A9P4IRW1_9PEZI|nr:oxidoreductase [Rhizodiscina lignyota]
MENQNRAAWLKAAKDHPFKVDDAPTYTPGDHEVLIRTRAVAINPCDWAVQRMGIICKEYPAVLGEDIGGEIVAVGPGVTKHKVGDHVLACSDLIIPSYGAFQLFVLAHENLTAKLPDNVSFAEGAVLPLGLCTAATSLFAKENLALPHPQLHPQPTGKTLLVWGGSTSVGSCGIQMAKAAGLKVATTCSPRNFEYCKALGAEYVFDYGSPSVVEDIVNALRDEDMAGVFNAQIFNPSDILKSGQIASQLNGKKFLATVHVSLEYIPQGIPADVEIGILSGYGTVCKDNEVGEAVWGNWLSAALANGSMKCKPDPKVIGRGLEKIQEACDVLKAGVSASKIVVELP